MFVMGYRYRTYELCCFSRRGNWLVVTTSHHSKWYAEKLRLGALLQAQGDLLGARPYYEQALAICEAALGPAHPTTTILRANLAALDASP
jgi:hypothetical protein